MKYKKYNLSSYHFFINTSFMKYVSRKMINTKNYEY